MQVIWVKYLSIMGLNVAGKRVERIGFAKGTEFIYIGLLDLPIIGSVSAATDEHLPESIEVDLSKFNFSKEELQNFVNQMMLAGWRHLASSEHHLFDAPIGAYKGELIQPWINSYPARNH